MIRCAMRCGRIYIHVYTHTRRYINISIPHLMTRLRTRLYCYATAPHGASNHLAIGSFLFFTRQKESVPPNFVAGLPYSQVLCFSRHTELLHLSSLLIKPKCLSWSNSGLVQCITSTVSRGRNAQVSASRSCSPAHLINRGREVLVFGSWAALSSGCHKLNVPSLLAVGLAPRDPRLREDNGTLRV